MSISKVSINIKSHANELDIYKPDDNELMAGVSTINQLKVSSTQPIATLIQLRAGKAMPFTREQLSAINKSPIASANVNYLGLLCDEQADRRHHGGPLKAVHQMAPATYQKINEHFDLNISVGLLGENLTTAPMGNFADLDEHSVCIGDVFQYGDAPDCVQLQVVQPRRPCFKINDQIGAFNKANIASWVSAQGIAGWYFKVIKSGTIATGMPVYLIERPYAFATLDTLWQLTNLKQKKAAQVINPWLAIDCLEDSWKKVLTKKIIKP